MDTTLQQQSASLILIDHDDLCLVLLIVSFRFLETAMPFIHINASTVIPVYSFRNSRI